MAWSSETLFHQPLFTPRHDINELFAASPRFPRPPSSDISFPRADVFIALIAATMEIVFAADPAARLSRHNLELGFTLDVTPIAIVGDGYSRGVVIPWMDDSNESGFVFFFSFFCFLSS